MPTTKPFIIAHRGASGDVPENTRAAFLEAWRQGADAIEGDVHLTADGRIVVVHDSTMERTAGIPLIVRDATLETLRCLDVGAWMGAEWADQRVLTLGEMLALVPTDKHVFIEVKTGPEILPALFEVLADSSLSADQTSIICFDENVVFGVKKRHPRVRALWLAELEQADGRLLPTPERIVATLKRCRADGVGVGAHESLNSDFVHGVLDAGYGFHVWTVDDPAWGRQLLGMGAQSLTTNFPARLRSALRK